VLAEADAIYDQLDASLSAVQYAEARRQDAREVVSASVIARCAPRRPAERVSTSPAVARSLSRFVCLRLVCALLHRRTADWCVRTLVSALAGACWVRLCGPCAGASRSGRVCSVSIGFGVSGTAVRCGTAARPSMRPRMSGARVVSVVPDRRRVDSVTCGSEDYES
jgi:hypothetical protein